jgi:hypothetical protein
MRVFRFLSSSGVLLAAAMIVISTTAFRCPGPEPKASEDGGGAGGDGSSGTLTSTTQSASDASSSSGPPCMANIADDPMNCGACFHACGTQNTSGLPVCEGGVCVASCIPGWADVLKPPPPVPDDGCETHVKRVFLTATPVAANFGGALGADSKCLALGAQNFGGGTSWKAWVSDAIAPPIPIRFTPSNGPYVLAVSGAEVAANFGELVSGNISHPIDETENGGQITGAKVWTGTTAINAMPSSMNCANWTVANTSAFGDEGDSGATNMNWTEDGNATCILDDRRLYCFEQ